MKIELCVMFLIFCGKLVHGAVIFETLVPDNSSCLEPRGYGCICLNESDCNVEKHFECIDYKCYCMNPMHRIYDNKLEKCVGLFGSKCDMYSKDGLKCIRNAECDDGRCVCREGYSVTSNLMCMVNYGEKCGPNQCNTDQGLACKSETCQCIDSLYIYSAVTKKCFDPEGFVSNVFNWLGRGLLRETVIHSTYKFILEIIRILTFPKRILRFVGR